MRYKNANPEGVALFPETSGSMIFVVNLNIPSHQRQPRRGEIIIADIQAVILNPEVVTLFPENIPAR